MSVGESVRAFVKQRLASAAEDISALFEKTIAEYEQQLSRSNLEKQLLLEQMLAPRLEQKITQTSRIHEEPEEQVIKHEDEPLPVFIPESSAVSLKREEPSSFQQRQTESDTDNSDDWEPLFVFSGEQTENNTDEEQHNQVQGGVSLQIQSGSERTGFVNSQDSSGSNSRADRRKHQCTVCEKTFAKKHNLDNHVRTHTGDKPYSCSTCKKSFSQKSVLYRHQKTHTGDKPFSCSTCKKLFTRKSTLNIHQRTHTGDKPYSCRICKKSFAQRSTLNSHQRMHTGEKPYSCKTCKKTFATKWALDKHRRTHMCCP